MTHTTSVPTTSAQWANALDVATRQADQTEFLTIGEYVSFAYAAGTAAGVELDYEADDAYCSRLVSADATMAVRYNEQAGWWEAA
jgi:hypothetical protein